MEIGVYTECLNRRYTGVEMMTHLLVENMAKHHRITCFHSKNSSHPAFEQCSHHIFKKPLPLPAYNQLAALLRLKCFNNLDLLHLPSPHIPFFKKPKAPVVITVHDIIPAVSPQFHNAKRNFYFKHVLPRALRKTDAVIASSESTKHDLIKHYSIEEEKIHVVHLALPAKQKIKREPDGTILYLGTLEPRKNVEGIIRAYALLKKQGIENKLVIAGGKGWNYSTIFSLTKKLGLAQDILFKDYVSEQEKKQLYSQATAFVWPSFCEGFGLPVLEAMQYGVPVITSNTSSLPEIVGDAGILVDPHAPEKIAAALHEVITSPQKQEELSQKGLKQAEKFSIEKYTSKTLAAYNSVIR